MGRAVSGAESSSLPIGCGSRSRRYPHPISTTRASASRRVGTTISRASLSIGISTPIRRGIRSLVSQSLWSAEPFIGNSGGYATLNFIPTQATIILGLIAGTWMKADLPRWALLARLFSLRACFCWRPATEWKLREHARSSTGSGRQHWRFSVAAGVSCSCSFSRSSSIMAASSAILRSHLL